MVERRPWIGLSVAASLACAARGETNAQPTATSPEGAPPLHGTHRHHGDMTHRFEDADAWAKEFDSPERLTWQKPDDVVARLELPRDAVIADIGAGTGYFAVRFARAVPDGKVFASDIEPDMVRYLRERAKKEGLANLVAVEGTRDDPRLPERADVVFLCNVYHHVADREAFFSRLTSAVSLDGRLVIVDFEKDAPEDAPGPPREHRVAREQLADELARAGWRLTAEDRELLPYQYIAIFGVAQSE